MRMLYRFLACIFLAVSAYSCQQEIDPNTGTTSAVTGDFRAKIDGSQWVANKVASASRISGVISIVGQSTDKKLIAITLTDSGVHHYTLDDASFNVAAYQDSMLASPIVFSSNASFIFGFGGGTVDITSIDTVHKKISGTFTFNVLRATDTLKRKITEGSFTNLSYVTSLVTPPTGTDTFHVKIAGTLYTPPVVFGAVTPAVPPLTAKIGITGTDATASKTVGMFIPADVTPGTYTFDFFGGNYIGQYNPDTNPNHSEASTSGTLVILEHNTTTKRIRGTFQFHAEELLNPAASTELTEGYFSIIYH